MQSQEAISFENFLFEFYHWIARIISLSIAVIEHLLYPRHSCFLNYLLEEWQPTKGMWGVGVRVCVCAHSHTPATQMALFCHLGTKLLVRYFIFYIVNEAGFYIVNFSYINSPPQKKTDYTQKLGFFYSCYSNTHIVDFCRSSKCCKWLLHFKEQTFLK